MNQYMNERMHCACHGFMVYSSFTSHVSMISSRSLQMNIQIIHHTLFINIYIIYINIDIFYIKAANNYGVDYKLK